MQQPTGKTVNSIIERLRLLRGTVPLPEPGFGWRNPEEAWFRLIGQICAIGNSRAWDALADSSTREHLAILQIREEGERASAYVHGILAKLRIRYCSPRSSNSAKAKAIADNAFSFFIADANGTVCLLDRVQESAGKPADNGTLTFIQAKDARRLLIREVRFFGPKSASDFLLGLGLADSLLAFDIRLLNLLIDQWGFDPSWRNRVHRLDEYEKLEEEMIDLFCGPLEIRPVELDRLLFYGYPSLRKPAPSSSEIHDVIALKSG